MATASQQDDSRERRVDPRRARTRAALIAAAQQLLAEGRVEVSIQEITDTAGVGFGSFYNHFDAKDQLWAVAVSEALRAHGDFVAALTAGIDDPAEVFCVGMRLTGRLQREFPHLARVLVNTGTATLMADRGGLITQAQSDIEAAMAAGRFDVSDSEFAIHLTAGALLSVVAMLDAHPELDAAAVSDEFAERVLRSFGLSAKEAHKLVSRPLPELDLTAEEPS
jgi:AcrR family transcriptional regulator